VILKVAGATSHLRRRAHCVSETFDHTRVCPGETTTHSHDASIPAVYGLAESVRSHDGAVTSVTTAEMLMPITAPTIATTAMIALTKHSLAATAKIANKSSRASLQLSHELGGYIRRMRSRTPTKNEKSITNTKILRPSLSATPQLSLRLGGY
jgi:hypothetical protein